MKFTEIPAPYFDLAMALDSGHVFHWKKVRKGRCRLLGRCMVSTRSDELRPEIGTTKSRKRNETNRAAGSSGETQSRRPTKINDNNRSWHEHCKGIDTAANKRLRKSQ